ncbi:MAG: phosphatase PAP2 family protein [Rubrivivax sp.]
MNPVAPSNDAWLLLTRLGEAQVLLPVMAAALLWLWRSNQAGQVARGWLASTAVVATLTTASKVAFIGFALGYAPLNFTGISGHAMFAASVLPVLSVLCAGEASVKGRRVATLAGYSLAVLIAYSRLKVGAHSASEAISGYLLGSLASAWVLRRWHPPMARPPVWLAAGLALWMATLPFSAPPSLTHDWVVRLSLAVSDRTVPYSRWRMHRDHRLQQQRLAPAQARDIARQPQPVSAHGRHPLN